MRFSWFFFQNMLENGHSNLQTKFRVHITSNIFKKIQFKNHRIAPTPPTSQLWKLTLPPGVGGRFEIFSLKSRERMNLKVPWAILPLDCAILNTRAKTVRGLLQPPLGELGLINTVNQMNKKGGPPDIVKWNGRASNCCHFGLFSIVLR